MELGERKGGLVHGAADDVSIRHGMETGIEEERNENKRGRGRRRKNERAKEGKEGQEGEDKEDKQGIIARSLHNACHKQQQR